MKSLGSIILVSIVLASASFSVALGWRLAALAIPQGPDAVIVVVPAPPSFSTPPVSL